ncbi:MAG: Hit-like cell-cycle regulation protein [Bacteroidetes bacterium]|jgi:histidine triad (HIT) family protein|nr:Hit-like cell-cycle regulation protein [Bacteroidota bacterium]
MDCIFCKIIQRKLPAEILYENDKVISILDINPIHFGHALVIPKRHCLDFLSIPEDDLHDVLHATQIVARAIVSGLKLEGFNIFSNNGRIAGQSVFHFHMHITPRYVDDNIKFVLQLKSYDGQELADYGMKIRQHIRHQLTEKENS